MDAEIRKAFADAREETRRAFAEARVENRAAFDRINRWFALSQAQHVDFRNYVDGQFAEVREDIGGLKVEIGGLKQDVGGLKEVMKAVRIELAALRHEFHRFRDWATTAITELRSAVNNLTRRFEAMG